MVYLRKNLAGEATKMILRTPVLCKILCFFMVLVMADISLVVQKATDQDDMICPKVCSCEVDPKSGVLLGDCSNRNLTEIPNNLSPKFVHLDFSQNSLTNVPSKIFSRLEHLKVLDLSWNKLGTFSEDAFDGLVNLRELHLNTNLLSYCNGITPYQTGVFSDLQNLRVLYINNNTIDGQCGTNWSYPDGALSHLTNLHTLYMDGLTNTTFGPGFRRLHKLTTLSLSGLNLFCIMPVISNDTFINLKPTNLSYLNLQQCEIRSIQSGAFRPLRTIHTLDLTWQHLTFEHLKTGLEGLKGSPIKVLILNRIHDYGQEFVLPEKTFEPLINTNLTDLILSNSYIVKIEDNFIDYLPPSLQNLDLAQNDIVAGSSEWLDRIPKMKNLHTFNGSYQGMQGSAHIKHRTEAVAGSSMDTGKHFITDGLLTNSQRNLFRMNMFRQYPINYNPFVVDCPRNLQYLYMQHCHISGVAPPLNFTQNRLEYADMSGNSFKLWGPWYGLHNLKYLDIHNIQCDYLTSYFFQDMVSLEVLKFGDNNLSLPLSRDIQGQTFSGLKRLHYLDLSKNYLKILPPLIFNQQRNLETLVISNNYFTDWNVTISHMTNLTLLDLRNNRVTALGSFARSELDAVIQNGKIRVNLLGNQFQCSCENLDFLKWLHKRREYFLQMDRYSCTLPGGRNTSFVDLETIIKRLDLQCISSTMLIVSAVSLVGLLAIILAALFCHRHRWQVRFYKNKLALRLKLYEPLIEDDGQAPGATYDGFMSYEDSSHRFIMDKVYPILEQQRGMTLCLHTRDFVPGTPIAHNIYRAVHGSGKTVALLTEAYFQSEWCVYEFNIAYLESVHTGRQLLVPVLMEDIDFDKLPRDIYRILNCVTYLDYRNCTDEDFFDKLVEALQKREPFSQI